MTKALVALLALAPLGWAVAAEPGTADGSAPAESVIRQLEEQERLGVLNRDAATLRRLWADGFIVNTPLNSISTSRDTVLELVERGAISYASFERRIEQLRVLGDVVIVMGAETVRPVAEPPAPPVQRRFTHVWRNEAGNWRLIARHANNIPSP